jgi:uncharacterized protein YndB with AHSA1/START domain
LSENVITAQPGETWFSITRAFEAPRTLVWKCYTEPHHLARFWGPRDAVTKSTIDLRIGGVWRTDWTYANGQTYGYSSVYLELTAPVRIHYRDAPNDWPGGLDGLPPVDMLSTISLAEAAGRTTVTAYIDCLSVAYRDETVKRGFTGMVSVGNDRLEEYLSTLKSGGL